MPASDLIAVTGATGAVGGRVARLLAEAGAPQRLVVRDRTRAPELPGAEVRTASGYGDHEGMRAALEGAQTLFLVPASEAPDRVALHRTAIDAAVAAGVGRIVYLSFLGATPDHTFTFGRDHWHTEQIVRAAGPRWTFLGMSLYLDFIPSMAGDDGVIRGPAGEGRVAAVLRDDVAASAAAVLTSEGHDGRTYDLTGPEAFTLAEAAAAIGRATGREVSFHDESDDEALASRADAGAPEWEVRGWVSSYQAIRDGSLDVVSPEVRRLTGREPSGLEDLLRAL
jgi:NAD(P)H dehydrogenase (quinone)